MKMANTIFFKLASRVRIARFNINGFRIAVDVTLVLGGIAFGALAFGQLNFASQPDVLSLLIDTTAALGTWAVGIGAYQYAREAHKLREKEVTEARARAIGAKNAAITSLQSAIRSCQMGASLLGAEPTKKKLKIIARQKRISIRKAISANGRKNWKPPISRIYTGIMAAQAYFDTSPMTWPEFEIGYKHEKALEAAFGTRAIMRVAIQDFLADFEKNFEEKNISKSMLARWEDLRIVAGKFDARLDAACTAIGSYREKSHF